MTPPEAAARLSYADLGIVVPEGGRGDVKCHCPRCHGERKNRHDRSLSVNLDQGEWLCHHCGWASGLGKEARERGHLPAARPTSAVLPTQPRHPTPKNGPQPGSASPNGSSPHSEPENAVAPARIAPRTPPRTLEPWALSWLQQRKVSATETLAALGIGSSTATMHGDEVKVLHFPYTLDGELVNVKHRVCLRGGEPTKEFRQESGAPRTLFNIDTCRDAKTIVVVEGEMDVLACAHAGWDAVVSPPDGAPAVSKDGSVAEVGRKGDAFLEPTATAIFDAAKRIIVATDADAGGQRLGDWIVETFGPVKCWRVTFPEGCKDANDVLMQRGAADLDRVLSHAKPVDVPGITRLGDSREKLRDIWEQGFDPGVSTGWPTLDQIFRVRKRALISVTGNPGNGKTSLTNHLLINLAHLHDWTIAMFSPESGDDEELLGKFTQIVLDAPILPTAKERASWEAVEIAADWVDAHFIRIDAARSETEVYQSVTLSDIVERIEVGVLRYDLDAVIIDHWGRLESSRPKGMMGAEYLAVCLNALHRLARRLNLAIIVVGHPHKPEQSKRGESEAMPNPYDMADGAAWNNLSDYVIGIHRNKYSEPLNLTTFRVWKNRFEGYAGELGECYFTFDRRSGRFYCEGTTIPDRIGANPYPDLPDALRLSPAPIRAYGEMWTDEDL